MLCDKCLYKSQIPGHSFSLSWLLLGRKNEDMFLISEEWHCSTVMSPAGRGPKSPFFFAIKSHQEALFVVWLREDLHPNTHKAQVRKPGVGPSLGLALSKEIAALAGGGEEKHLARRVLRISLSSN